MPPFLLLLQIALPIALLAWLGLAPVHGRGPYIVQVLSTAVVLVTIGLVAPWAMPPWWVPYAYAGIFGVIVALHWRRRSSDRRAVPARVRDVAAIVPLLGLACFGGLQSAQAIDGHRLPDGDVVSLASPVADGHLIVENGGATLAVNGHLHTADPADPLHATAFGQARAVDLIVIDRLGLRSNGFWPTDPARYVSFGHPVVAPCEGTVVTSEDGHADQPVPQQDLSPPSGNHVMLDCGAVRVVLAHLQRGSIAVDPGQAVSTGDRIGRIGNSGASTEPHLHIHAERPDPAGGQSGRPVWLLIDDRFLARNDRLRGTASPGATSAAPQ